MYVDGHERPDVIKEREEFLNQIFNKFEQYVARVHCSKHQMADCCMVTKLDGIL